ncbi:MAG TPA: hypothetical protein VHH73_06670 [Verrucomicrobiae bacterium]|nr:hypothetical protein [Verrucomicrobiae bacterium]
MTTTKARVLKLVATFVAGLAVCVSAKAQSEIVYNNTANPSGDFNASYSSAFEFGDEVALQGVGRTLTDFQFEYFGSLTEDASKFMLLSIYKADGTSPAGSPGTLLFQTDPIQVHNGFQSVELSGISGVTLSDDIIWTITPFGINNSADKVSLLLYDPPTIGSSANDFWQKDASGWTRTVLNNSSGSAIANFGAKITVVPEPTAGQLLMLGGVGYLVFVGYKRRTARTA